MMRRTLDETPKLLVTGGASDRVEKAIGLPYRAVPDLVLQGLAVLAARAPPLRALMYHARTDVQGHSSRRYVDPVARCVGLRRRVGTGGGRAGRDAARRRASASQCHEADDWEGEDAASLESLIRDIVAGKVKHKGKLELVRAEIANIAAYWGQGKK